MNFIENNVDPGQSTSKDDGSNIAWFSKEDITCELRVRLAHC